MIGGTWTREQKAAYRAAFSLGRIGDELWVVIALIWALVCAATLLFVHGVLYLLAAVAGFAVLYWLTWRVLLPWLEHTMPAELRAARTYRELLRRWLAKEGAHL